MARMTHEAKTERATTRLRNARAKLEEKREAYQGWVDKWEAAGKPRFEDNWEHDDARIQALIEFEDAKEEEARALSAARTISQQNSDGLDDLRGLLSL